MPIVYIHGVAVRTDPPYSPETERYLRELIAPVVNPADPAGVRIINANWFDLGARFAWDLSCVPASRSSVLADEAATGSAEAPAERAVAVAQARAELAGLGETSELLLDDDGVAPPIRPSDLSPDDLSNFVATLLERQAADPAERAGLALAADRVARDPATRAALAASPDAEAEVDLLVQRVGAAYAEAEAAPGTLGPFELLDGLRSGMQEALDRARTVPGFVATRLAGPLLRDVNRHFALFEGDILVYLSARGTPAAPGPIPTRLLGALAEARAVQQQRGGEPIVVMSHSMGGQLTYDLVSAFLPGSPDPRFADLRIDFWCAAASQVAFFMEAKTFLSSSADDGFGAPPGRMVPFPDRRHLGGWWNVWDPNDYFSFTADGIFEGVQDEAFHSNLSGLEAHGGYLVRPAFFRRFAELLRASLAGRAEPPGAPMRSIPRRAEPPAPAPPLVLGLDEGGPPVMANGGARPAPRNGGEHRARANGGARPPAPAAAVPPSPAEPAPAAPRCFVNAEVWDQDGSRAAQPLVVERPYVLAFDVDTLERPTSLVTGAAIPESVWQPDEQEVELTVLVSSEQFEIGTEPQKLRVARSGKSRNKARFDITPKVEGLGVVDAIFLKNGNFISLVKLKLQVGAAPARASARERQPEVLGRTLGSAFALGERELTLVVQPRDGGFHLTLSGGTYAEADLAVTPLELSHLTKQVREALVGIVQSTWGDAREKVYQTKIDIPPEAHRAALQRLAREGYLLFEKLFFELGADSGAQHIGATLRKLAARGQLKIQVCSRRLILPWNVLYLAERFERDAVDPEAFLGLRHIVELIPLQPQLQAIDALTISSQPALAVSLNLDADIDRLMRLDLVEPQRAYWQRIGQLTGAKVVERSTAAQLRRDLADPATADQIIYFYCHATTRSLEEQADPGASSLKLTGDEHVTLDELRLEAPTRDTLASTPLVFINACESAELSPLFYDGFVPYFVAKGARGVIGTECLTPALFAREWSRRFFDEFLAGRPIGQVLLDLRREFLFEHNNLLGLLYAQYCDGDTTVDPALQVRT